MDRVKSALAEYDASLKRCPVNNPPRGKVYGPNDSCPYCSAKASGTCGIAVSAGWHLSEAVRRIVASEAEAA